jgi:hypothetical protein
MTAVGLNKEDMNKLSGLTTDGESANTGRKTGLWKRVEEYVGCPILSVWCACHRSDLAMEDLERSIPELKIWKINISSLAQYYRASAKRTKALNNIMTNMKAFPQHHEIRFAEHLCNLTLAILHNIDGCRKHWRSLQADPQTPRKDCQEAAGFMNTWQQDGAQVYLTAIMSDVCSIFRYLEKQLQKPEVIVSDTLSHRDVAIKKLLFMKDKPYPGGAENHLKCAQTEENDDCETAEVAPLPKRTAFREHNLVTSFARAREAIRNEIVLSAINFLEQRLDLEQEKIMQLAKSLCVAQTPSEFIDASECFQGFVDRNQFADAVFEQFDIIRPSTDITLNDYSVRLFYMLRRSSGLVKKVLSALCVTCPHSMTVERIVSTHTKLYGSLRTSSSLSTLQSRLLIYWNGVCTAEFDPRPAVSRFLQKRERREKYPDVAVYKGRDFIKNFFP